MLKENDLKQFYVDVEVKIDLLKTSIAMVTQVVPGPRCEGFGSGFFYEKDGWPFFITAKHVLDDIQSNSLKNQATFLHTRGKKGFISLPGLEFYCDSNCDIAAAPLWRLPKIDYAHVNFFKNYDVANFTEQFEKSFYSFTGFPASKNKTYTGQEIKAYQRHITLFMSDTSSKPTITSPFLFFEFDPKQMFDREFEKISMGYPAGMSGGPVFEITGSINDPTPKLAGMALSCLPKTNQLKMVRFDLIDQWLTHCIDQ